MLPQINGQNLNAGLLGIIDIGNSAAKANHILNKTTKPCESDVKDYFMYLVDKDNNPTRGMLAQKQFKRKINPLAYERNLEILESEVPETRFMTQQFEKTMDKLYPKTRKLREYIVSKGRVVLDTVKPAKGYTLIDEIAAKLLKHR